MIKIFKLLLYIHLIYFLIGCGVLEAKNARSKRIIGNIYVINLNLPEHPGFYPIIEEQTGNERHLLKDGDYVDYLKYNDSILLIKTLPNPEVEYYLFRHNNGKSILDSKDLTDLDFFNYEKTLGKYDSFNSVTDQKK